MPSKKPRSMPPPPVPSPRSFAPGLALRKPSVDPYNPTPRPTATEAFSFLRTEPDTEAPRGTWSTIDPETGARTWDTEYRRQKNDPASDTPSIRSASVAPTNAEDSWMHQWAEPSLPAVLGAKSTIESFSRTSSHERTDDTDATIDPEVRRLFVDTRDIMLDNSRPTTLFDRRNQKSLAKGNATKIKNMIGNDVVSIVHQPIDDRVKYRDANGNYVDGIDRGKMKKRYEDEWRQRLDNRAAQMERLSKIKLAWEALSPAEKARRIEKREENAKLVSGLGAGLESRDDLYEFDEIPELYRRETKWTVDGSMTKASSTASWVVRSSASGYSSDLVSTQTVTNRPNYPVTDHSTHGLPLRNRHHDSNHGETSLGKRKPNDRTCDDTWSSDNSFSVDTPSEDDYLHRDEDHDGFCFGGRPRVRPRYKGPPSGLLAIRNPTYHNRPPSMVPSGQFSGFSFPSKATGKASSIGKTSYQSSKGTPSVTSETVTVLDPAPELALLEDLTARKEDYEDNDGAIDKFDAIVAACSKNGRVVQMTLLGLVKYGSSAVGDRIFSGRVQEIQYFPADRMALVVFLVPKQAAAFVRHVRNLREQDEHEFRRLQINVEWYQGLEKEAVYPAQTWTLASVVSDDASRVLHISHVPVEKKVEDFADEMKLAFPDKIMVKTSLHKPPQRYVQARDGKAGIIEFASIRDAAEVLARINGESIAISGYERSAAEWFPDPCERVKPALPFCDYSTCGGEVPKRR